MYYFPASCFIDLLVVLAVFFSIERVASKTTASHYVNESTPTDWRLDGVDCFYPGIGRRDHGEPSGAQESLQVLLSSYPSPPFLHWIGKIALPLQDRRPPSAICWRQDRAIWSRLRLQACWRRIMPPSLAGRWRCHP